MGCFNTKIKKPKNPAEAGDTHELPWQDIPAIEILEVEPASPYYPLVVPHGYPSTQPSPARNLTPQPSQAGHLSQKVSHADKLLPQPSLEGYLPPQGYLPPEMHPSPSGGSLVKEHCEGCPLQPKHEGTMANVPQQGGSIGGVDRNMLIGATGGLLAGYLLSSLR